MKKNVKKTERWIKVCPKCKSKEVKQRGMISRHAYSQNYVCLTCGFQSPLFPEISPEEAKKLPVQSKNFSPSSLPPIAMVYGKPKASKLKIIVIFMLLLFLLLMLLFFG